MEQHTTSLSTAGVAHPPGWPTITVVVPAHNASRFLADCLGSIARQTSPATEVILVDDGSSDGTADSEPVRAALARGLQLLTLESNSGPGTARMAGVEAARSEWIAFLDADDRWLPDHLETIRRLIRDVPPADVVCASAVMLGEPFLSSPLALEREIQSPVAELIKANFVVQSAAAVRRETLVAAGGYDRRMRVAEDYELWVRLALSGTRFAHSANVTCLRQAHADQATARLPLHLVRGAWSVRRRAVELLASSGDAKGHEIATAALPIAVETDLRAAWSARSRSFIEAVLETTSWTDQGTVNVRAPWARRITGLRWHVLSAVASVYDRLPSSALQVIRGLRTRNRDGNDSPESSPAG